MKRRVLLILMALVLVFGISACKKKEEPKEETKKETKKEVVEEPEEEEVVEPDAANTNTLTGLPTLTDGAIGKRPVAVMINNAQAAMPQYGISQADIIFEIPVEGDNTRLMALYGDYTQVPKICPVRSLRAYFASYSEGFDAFMIHWGMDDTMQEYFDALGIERFDGISGAGGMFGRDEAKQAAGYALEHTGYVEGSMLPQVLTSAGRRLDLAEDKKDNAFVFNKLDELIPADGNSCNKASINFGAQSATLNYDEASKTYKKDMNGSPQMDSVTNEQLAFTNVLILETQISVRDEVGHKEVVWDGGGTGNATGYYISGGKVQKIFWSKDANNEKSRIHLFDENHNTLKINRGKTYIAVNYANRGTFE